MTTGDRGSKRKELNTSFFTEGLLTYVSADGRIRGKMLHEAEDLPSLIAWAAERAKRPGTWELFELYGGGKHRVTLGPFSAGALEVREEDASAAVDQ